MRFTGRNVAVQASGKKSKNIPFKIFNSHKNAGQKKHMKEDANWIKKCTKVILYFMACINSLNQKGSVFDLSPN